MPVMPSSEKWFSKLEEYIRQGEPSQAEKGAAWCTAIGLQDVDGLKTSAYLLETAKEHIEGKIDITTAQRQVQAYYEARSGRSAEESRTKEADVVSTRITALLEEDAFQFSPAEWQTIHKRLFTGIYDHAGMIRTYNISKKEWVLKGASVTYASWESIRPTLEYDFQQEKQFSYVDLPIQDAIRHISEFTSGIWQIHPFMEGNTRSTAVFIIKYLKTFGFRVSNETFAEHSWYFRNALVRANYNNYTEGVRSTTIYLDRFFENLLAGSRHELKNRTMHLDYAEEPLQSAIAQFSKCKNCTLNELAVLNALARDPGMTQIQLAHEIGKSERTVKALTVELQKKGLLERKNGKRNGEWVVKTEMKP